MRLLLDTHVLIAVARQDTDTADANIAASVKSPENLLFVSAASIWEIAIKYRLGKLDPGIPLENLGQYLKTTGFTLLDVTDRHAVEAVVPAPATRDPFDRMLLAQCSVEGMRLVTLDRAIADHPLAWR